ENDRADLPADFAKALGTLKSAPYTGTVGYGTEVVPKIAATWVIRQSGIQSRRGPTRLRVNYGEGIKSPTLLEAFSPNPFFIGNPALKPERSRNFDIGLEQFIWKDKYRVEIVFLDNRFRNQVVFQAQPGTLGDPIKLSDGRLTHFINYDRTRARGMELSVSARPRRWLMLGGSYTFLDSELIRATEMDDLLSVPSREIG